MRGGLPFKEVFPAYELPPQSRCRRRYAYPGLVRQKPQPEQRLDEGGSYTFYKPAVVSELEVGRPVCTELREGYEKADSQSQHRRPCGEYEPLFREQEPQENRRERRRSDKTAAQGIKKPPTLYIRHGAAMAEYPSGVLPVAPYPAVAAAVIGERGRGEGV